MNRVLDRPRLLLTLCALFWAGNFVLARAMHETLPPVGLAFWRWVGACLLVLPFVWRPMWRQRELIGRHFWRLSVLALLGVSGFNTLVYMGLQTTTATNSVLIQSTMPVQILLLNGLLFSTRVHAREMVSIGLSLVGVLVIISRGQPHLLGAAGWTTGDLWVLGAALVWALYSVLLRWRPTGLLPGAFLGFTLVVGTIALWPLYLFERLAGQPMNWDSAAIATVIYVAVFPSALAYLFWNRGVALLGPAAAGHFIHLMPLFGSLMAVTFLGERLGWYHGVGAVLVAGGIGLTWRRHRPT